MFFRKRDWPWGLIGLVFALLGVLLYVLYQLGPRTDVALMLLSGIVIPYFSGDDANTLLRIIAKAVSAAILSMLLWWGGFWSPSIQVCADLCRASEAGR
jgi:drug/metabolite transporter (DMT)-like permease